MEWSGVNPSDVKSRAGSRSKVLPFARITPHSDGAGLIDAVGEGVLDARIGERVWLWNAAWGRANGTAAEYVTLPAAQAVKLPDNTGTDVGACLGIPALTAYHAVEVDGGVRGKTVLIAGGAGAVGYYAIQFARLLGAARVLSTVSSAEKAVLAQQAGADVCINYRNDDVDASIRELTGGHGVDRIIEVNFSANIAVDLQVVKPNGDIVVYGSDAAEFTLPFVPLIVKNVGLRFFIVYNLAPDARARAIAQLTSFLESNQLRHNISHRVPLDRIAQAHELVESGRSMGNVIVSI